MILLEQKNPSIQVRNWIYTQVCTGKNRLDTHFSFVKLKLEALVLDGNNILTEVDIYIAMNFERGIVCTFSYMFDGSKIKGPILK